MIYDTQKERPRQCSGIEYWQRVQIKISCGWRENGVCEHLDRAQSGLFDDMRESLSLPNQKSYYCASKSLAGNKIILSQSETGVGETIFGRQWPRFSTCKVAITALIGFSLVLRHDRLQLVDVGASEVGHLGGN